MWFDILKYIKLEDDSRVKIKSGVWNKFKQDIRDKLREVVLPFYGIPGYVSDNPRKSNITLKETWKGDILTMVVGFRNPFVERIIRWPIVFRYNMEENVYYPIGITGTPTLAAVTHIDHWGRIPELIAEEAQKDLEEGQRNAGPPTNLREEIRSDKPIAEELERENPGYRWNAAQAKLEPIPGEEGKRLRRTPDKRTKEAMSRMGRWTIGDDWKEQLRDKDVD